MRDADGFSLISTVKKKCSAGLKLSNLMNLGRKKSTSLEPAERSLETACKKRSASWAAGLDPWAAARLQEGSSDSEGRGCRSRFKRVLGMWRRSLVAISLHCR